MLSRREFLHTMGAVAVPVSAWQPAAYDLVIRGGRVFDPVAGTLRVADVGVRGGRIAAVAATLPGAAADVLDATGSIVSPGLVDIHAHTSADMPPAHCLSTGVTAMVDAGSGGADNIAPFVELAKQAPNRVRLLINLGRTGLGGRGELLDFANADSAAARQAIEAHRDIIIGIKARLSANVVGDRALDAIDRAHAVTGPLKLPLMVHVGQPSVALAQILTRLRPGDIVTHVYAPPPNGILDDNNRLFPDVLAARQRGIIFDVGNGRSGHITWEVAERAIGQGFLPDTISSDLTAPGRTDRVFDFPTVLSKFLLLGMSVEQVLACATRQAAQAIAPFKDLGTLTVGAPADIAVFELRQGQFEFVDNVRAVRTGTQKLFTRAVIVGGSRVEF